MSSNLEPFPMLPDASSPNRLPAPSPCRSCVVSKAGWITALVASLAAVFLFFRLLSSTAEAKLQRNNAELTQVEAQSLKQQLYAERILAERQITDINGKSEPSAFARLSSTDNTLHGLLVWMPAHQSGALFTDALPAATPEEEYRLWMEDAAGNRISAGTVAASGAKTEFKPDKPINNVTRFTVTKERRGAANPNSISVLTGTP